MLFSSPIFLFLFLPVTFLFYYLLPRQFKNMFLLVMSLIFYSWGEQELVALLICSSVVDFSAGLIIEKGLKKLGLLISILFNLGILLYFKYADFAFTNLSWLLNNFNLNLEATNRFAEIVLPLGISFYTFQTMSYTIDVYRGEVKACRNFINFATYVSLFPQLVAGPIVRYTEVEAELKERHTDLSQFSKGMERFIVGLGKKILIANNCAYVADGIFEMPFSEMSALTAWIGVLAYSLQIYFDFSGYSDMAIGLGRMLGFKFPENFNFPYISRSIREFWRRWHMTLSNWFKDYLYISLGGNRINLFRTILNLFIVFVITGLWHGANWTFIVWGLIHGVFIIMERFGFETILRKVPKVFSHLYVLFVVSIAWVFFRSDSLGDALHYIKAMFSFSTPTNIDFLKFYISNETFIVLLFAIIFSSAIHQKIKFRGILQPNQNIYEISKYMCLMIILFVCCIYISVDSYNPFIYFRF